MAYVFTVLLRLNWSFHIFRNFKFVRVSSPVVRYFYNMYIVKSMILCFSLMSRTLIYFHVHIRLDFPITFRNDAVF